ncbi:MAG: nucleoside deaminase [Rhodothermus sp.]|nr:nucleoside deaminase [Rhodothermus sp.]
MSEPEMFIREVIRRAIANVQAGGGPFAALVVYHGEILAVGTNRVTIDNDPTAHAEVVAIREACRRLGHFQLTGCDLYTSCEPCPMCLGAIYWARPSRVFYAATRHDAARAGFDDALIYEELQRSGPERRIPFIHVPDRDAWAPFRVWLDHPERIAY